VVTGSGIHVGQPQLGPVGFIVVMCDPLPHGRGGTHGGGVQGFVVVAVVVVVKPGTHVPHAQFVPVGLGVVMCDPVEHSGRGQGMGRHLLVVVMSGTQIGQSGQFVPVGSGVITCDPLEHNGSAAGHAMGRQGVGM